MDGKQPNEKAREGYGEAASGVVRGAVFCYVPSAACGDCDMVTADLYGAGHFCGVPRGVLVSSGCGTSEILAEWKAGEVDVGLSSGGGAGVLLSVRGSGASGTADELKMAEGMLAGAKARRGRGSTISSS